MNDQDKPVFAALITGAAELYSKKISTALLNFYWKSLKQFDFSDIERAVMAHINDRVSGEFMVKPCHIRGYIEGDSETRTLQALSKVESAVRHIGNYTSVAFDDPIIHAVIEDMGGWIKYCSCKGDDIPFQSNEFIKRYRGYLQGKIIQYPAYLVGSVERSHRFYGFEPKEPPVLVGDKNKVKQVMQKGGNRNSLFHQEIGNRIVDQLKSLSSILAKNLEKED